MCAFVIMVWLVELTDGDIERGGGRCCWSSDEVILLNCELKLSAESEL